MRNNTQYTAGCSTIAHSRFDILSNLRGLFLPRLRRVNTSKRSRSNTAPYLVGRNSILAVFVILLLLAGFGAEVLAERGNGTGTVSTAWRVDDGDTITALLGNRQSERIRLIGIDAPEMGQQRWGERAKRHLAGMLSSSRNIYVEYDVERRDKYGRLLAYIRTSDGRLVNAEMLKDGYAVLYTFPPNVRHVEELRAAQKQARDRRVGIWGRDGLSQMPEDWRRQHPRR